MSSPLRSALRFQARIVAQHRKAVTTSSLQEVWHNRAIRAGLPGMLPMPEEVPVAPVGLFDAPTFDGITLIVDSSFRDSDIPPITAESAQ